MHSMCFLRVLTEIYKVTSSNRSRMLKRELELHDISLFNKNYIKNSNSVSVTFVIYVF